MTIQHNRNILTLFLLLLTSVAAFPAQADECSITALHGDVLTVPVALSQATDIEAVDIKINFDANVLQATGAELTGGILNSEDYSLTVNQSDGEVTIVIYSIGNVISDTGDVVFISFEVLGKCSDVAFLSFTKFLSNSSSASGGFHVNDEFCQYLRVSTIHDINGDGKTGLEEAVYWLNSENPDIGGSVCALGIVTGTEDMFFDISKDGKVGMPEAIYALRCVSGMIPECSPADTGLRHAVYALRVVTQK